MIDIRNTLYTLLNVSAITNALDTWDGAPALFVGTRIPEGCNAHKTINVYITSPQESNEYTRVTSIAACRGDTEYEALAVATLVYNALHRYSHNGYYTYCALLPVVPPADETDVYNAPVQITITRIQ